MLVSLLSFYRISSFIIFIFTRSLSALNSADEQCSTDDDCDFELMCNIGSNTCTCPEPYFWRDDIRACFGCPSGWFKFENKTCLLFAISQSPGVAWQEAQRTCESLIAQPMIIRTTDEFLVLQRQIESILKGDDALTATLYFHQGAWIDIDNEWIESYIWCDEKEQGHSSDCVQIQQESSTNTICLRYVSCVEQAHYMCEASPMIQSELETKLAENERLNARERNEEIMIRAPPKTTKRTTIKQTTRTTKKNPGAVINNVGNVLTNGINTFGQLSNALGNVVGGNTNQNSNFQNNLVNNNNNNYNDLETPEALSSSSINVKSILLYGGLIVGGVILLIIIIIFIVCLLKKKQTIVNSRTSIESAGTYTSVVTYE